MTSGPSSTDAEALDRSLHRLSVLVLGVRPLVDVLGAMAEYAATAVPGADGVGVTMLRPGRPDVLAAGAHFVKWVDEVQYRVQEGPCIDAVAMRRPQICGSLGGEARWPRFGPRVGRMGVHSALSLPLLVDGQAVGALNVYAHRRDAFADDAVAAGERFAEPAAVAVVTAGSLDRAARLAQQFESALGNRAVIDQAIGILMSRNGSGADTAFEILRNRSQAEGIKVADVAAQLVAQAVDRARARRSSS